MVHILIEKIFLWLYLIWILYLLKSIQLVVEKLLCKRNFYCLIFLKIFRDVFSLSGVTLNVAARDGYADGAPTVESCRCPANYTGTSCEKCAEGYGRPHPLVGIYLGQCWSCRALCNERSDRCDRETGKCSV
jgi:hypothetical protein